MLYSNKSRYCVVVVVLVVVGLKVLKKSARFNCRFFTIFHFRVSKIDSGYIKDYLIIEKKTIPQKKNSAHDFLHRTLQRICHHLLFKIILINFFISKPLKCTNFWPNIINLTYFQNYIWISFTTSNAISGICMCYSKITFFFINIFGFPKRSWK